MLELYHSGHTTCSKQVRHCLNEKGLAYTSRYVELWSYENLKPEYLKLNPFGVVPTLVHDGAPIANSFCIMEYVEDVFPEKPLRPADPVQRAKSRLWCWLADEVHPAMADATYSANMRNRARNMDRATLDRVLSMMPVPERRERLATVAGKGFDEHEIAHRYERLAFFFDRLATDFGRGPWICGETFSLGDVAVLAIVDRVRELKPEMVAKVPAVAAWHARMFERDAVKKVYALDTDEVPRRPQGGFELRATG
jgi:glutathione S-transferase